MADSSNAQSNRGVEMVSFLNCDEFRGFSKGQVDPVLRNALEYGGERIFFVDGNLRADFDMLCLGRIIAALFDDREKLQSLDQEEASSPISAKSFSDAYLRCDEAIDYAAAAESIQLRNWLALCLRQAAGIKPEPNGKFDLEFFTRTMERFYFHGYAIPALLRGESFGGAFEIE